MNILTTVANAAAASESKKDLFASLGIDWTLLAFQIVAFLVLVWLLGKYVYPVLVKAVDDRQAKIDEGTKAAELAAKKAESAQADVEKLLKQAREEARDIVATAKSEASASVAKAEKNAKARSERIVAEAHEEITKEVLAAKKTLEKDTLDLVKKAASLATASIADEKLDTALVKKSIEEAK